MTEEMQEALERELNDAKSIEDQARRHEAIEMVQSHMLAALIDCQRKTAERVKELVARSDEAKHKIEGAKYDKVSGQLFRNDGTGAFIIGPDK